MPDDDRSTESLVRTQPTAIVDPASIQSAECFALVIAWSAREPSRVGEVALLDPEYASWILGRYPPAPPPPAAPATEGDHQPLPFFRQRPPGVRDAGDPRTAGRHPGGEGISRRQLLFRPSEGALFVESIGQCELLVNGAVVQKAEVHPGDTLYLRNQLLLYCTRRPSTIPALRTYPADRVGGFGLADQDHFVGESPAIWGLRDLLAACAQTNFHVLVIGDSGSGKELVAQALHRLSERGARKLIADNIAAMPPGLATVMLFGNRKNFPNPGMEEHVGLIGAAHGSTLLLDEIGDMSEQVQPMFLRITERNGEYFRLGEQGQPRVSDFRLIGATNRPEQLRHELKRRFQREIWVAGLNERKEDIPLLVRHLLREQARSQDVNAQRFLRDGQPGVHPWLIEQLLHHTYRTHVAELGFLLGKCIERSDGDVLLPLGAGMPIELRNRVTTARPRPTHRPLPAAASAQRSLLEAGGDITRAARALNISRDQLNRLIRREKLQVTRSGNPQREVDASSNPQAGKRQRS